MNEIIDCSFNNSKKHQKPLIFIYFADHGESPSTSRGHDSSRLTYEMLHVPFIILFNEEAYKVYGEKFEFLKKIKTKNLTLKFMSDLLIYLFEIDIKNSSDQKIVYQHNDFKSLDKNFIMASEDLNGNLSKLQTFFNYKGNLVESELSEEKYSKNDTSLNLWQLGNYFKNNELSDFKKIEKIICQHRANSFIVQYRSSLSNSCFETDVFFKDKVISTHDLKKDTKLYLEDFFKSSYGNGDTLWLDSKNLYLKEACNSAFKWLEKNQSNFVSLIVETPSRSIKNIEDIEWVNCIQKIDNIKNVQVAYYLPTEKIKACSKLNNDKVECNNITNDIVNFLKEIEINLITFDYEGYDFVKSKKEFSKFKWNIWHINKISELAEIMKRDNIGAILLPNDKFFNNLN